MLRDIHIPQALSFSKGHPSIPRDAMPWLVNLLLLSVSVFASIVEVVVLAILLICCLFECFWKVGWMYLDF